MVLANQTAYISSDTRKVKLLSLPETIKKKSTFRAKALRRELVGGGGRGKHACFYTKHRVTK